MSDSQDDARKQEVVNALSLASRNLSDAAAALAQVVTAQYGSNPSTILADAGSIKVAIMLSANAVKVSETAANVARLAATLGNDFGLAKKD